MIENVILSLVSAMVYSTIFYVKKKESLDPEDFNKFKFASTIVVGLFVGIGYVYSGVGVTQEAIETQLMVYAGTTALVESILKTLYRRYLQD